MGTHLQQKDVGIKGLQLICWTDRRIIRTFQARLYSVEIWETIS
jgi:hypothetical protein